MPPSPPTSTSTPALEGRRYRITGVLGKGGFGKVYRAKLEGAGGFEKDVAIKLMRDPDVPELQLQRFRDEARILGLVRDRAIVTVDPPTRLEGRWAVVMEFVDGATVQRLMKLGPMPAGVVAEIIQEVARALDKVYRAAGPDGVPLKLLHRDIKPANLQLTADGEVKILDFGIARADFSAREAHTQAYVGGTRGYIAPERLDGKEGPEGDVYSLGVTAHLMLTGERPTRRQLMGLAPIDTSHLDEDGQRLMQLITRMRSVVVADRPTAREVEEGCTAVRRQSEGVTLRRWAEEHVPQAVRIKTDEMVGSVLSETLAALLSKDRVQGLSVLEDTQPTLGPRQRGPLVFVAAAVAIATILLVAFVSFGGVAGAGLLLATLGSSGTDAEAPALPAAAPEAAPKAARVAPEVAPEAAPEPPPEAPAPTDAAEADDEGTEAAPAPAPRARPRPAPAPETPEVDPNATVYRITLASVPMGADVFVDGAKVGQTPVLNLSLVEGPHQVKMVGDSETTVKTITLGRRSPTRWVWTGGETWEEHY